MSADEINLMHVLRYLRQRWVAIVGGAVIGLLGGGAYLMLSEKVYRLDIVVTSAAEEQEFSLGGLSGALGAAAGLGGGLFSGSDTANEGIALLHSKSIAAELIADNNLLPIFFDSDWDSEEKAWTVSESKIPTIPDGIEFFHDEVLRVKRDRELDVVTVSILWTDRELASRLAVEMVDRVNQKMRERTVQEATRNLDFLNEELSKSQNIESAKVISELMQQNLNKAAMANARREYAFRTIDPPIIPDRDQHVRPSAPVVALSSIILGIICALGLYEAVRSKRTQETG